MVSETIMLPTIPACSTCQTNAAKNLPLVVWLLFVVLKNIFMPGEAIVLNIAEQAVEQGINKLSPKTKAIVLNTVYGLVGVTLCVLAASQLIKTFFPKNQEQPIS